MNITEVTLLLPEAEAKKWIMFQQYYDNFSLLVEKKVFEQKNSAITLHFDSNGTLQVIQRADYLYSKKHEG